MSKKAVEELEKELNEFRKLHSKMWDKQADIFKVNKLFDKDIRKRIITIYSDMEHAEQEVFKNPTNEKLEKLTDYIYKTQNVINFWVNLSYLRKQDRINKTMLFFTIAIFVLVVVQTIFFVINGRR